MSAISDGTIRYTFYKKSVSHPMTIINRSAVPISTKRTTIFHECTRRMRNISQDYGWEKTAKHLTEYMDSLRISGYPEHFRYNILRGVISKEKEILNMVEQKLTKKHRTKQEIQAKKSSKPGRYKNTWFLRGQYKNTLKVTATPESKLAQDINNRLKKILDPELGATSEGC